MIFQNPVSFMALSRWGEAANSARTVSSSVWVRPVWILIAERSHVKILSRLLTKFLMTFPGACRLDPAFPTGNFWIRMSGNAEENWTTGFALGAVEKCDAVAKQIPLKRNLGYG